MGGARFKSSVAHAHEQCNAHLLPAVLLAGLAAGAFFSATGQEPSGFAGSVFMIMAAVSTCLEVAATYMLVLCSIFYATPYGETYYRSSLLRRGRHHGVLPLPVGWLGVPDVHAAARRRGDGGRHVRESRARPSRCVRP